MSHQSTRLDFGRYVPGDTLTATSSLPPSSLIWTLNGATTEATQSAALKRTGIVIAAGSTYIPDLSNSRVQKWTPCAITGSTVAGGNGLGSADNKFDRPTSVFLDKAGAMYVVDQNKGRIQKWVPGAVMVVIVIGDGPILLSTPTDVFFRGPGEHLCISIRELDGYKMEQGIYSVCNCGALNRCMTFLILRDSEPQFFLPSLLLMNTRICWLMAEKW